MIELRGVRIEVPGFAVRDVSLEVGQGEFFCLIGPTGSGKSLLLEAVAGLVRVARGHVLLAGADVTALPPERRGIGIVYQDSALFPHLTVLQNIRYGLRHRRLDPAESGPHVERLMDMLDIGRLRGRGVAHLSGGERQRVSLARALAVKPNVLLLDEPLTALDPNFRDELRRVLKELHGDMGLTFLMVTHDFAEALFLADRVAVLRRGELEQVGGADEVFRRPATPFVAGFVGMRNLFPVALENGLARFCGLECALPGRAGNGQGHLALRPEDIVLDHGGGVPGSWVSYSGVLERVVNLGLHFEAEVRCGQALFTVFLEKRLLAQGKIRQGGPVRLAFDPTNAHVI